jgi:glycosyltransferase involved in cell wall biosynthesis
VPLASAITAAGCGLVCAPRRDAIADAMRQWLSHRAAHADVAARARFCAAAFDWPVVAARIRRQYETLLRGAA